MTVQWHPIFAYLLRPLVEPFYELRTEMPVSDLPRAADLVLLRRTSSEPLPFTGLWRWLTPWNVVDFKGPTVSARVVHLDALLEVGLGVHRRLNQEFARQRRPTVGRADVSFWYVANHLGRRFLRSAEDLLGPFEALEAGVWRARFAQRSIMLVSGQVVSIDRDSLPVHLLSMEPAEHKQALEQVLAQNTDLLPVYGPWLASTFPALAREVAQMARAKNKKFEFNVAPFIKEIGWQEVIRQTGVKSLIEEVGVKPLIDEVGVKPLIEEVGVKPIIDEVGLDQLAAELTPAERKKLQKILQDM
jgi:hypothetical protein